MGIIELICLAVAGYGVSMIFGVFDYPDMRGGLTFVGIGLVGAMIFGVLRRR